MTWFKEERLGVGVGVVETGYPTGLLFEKGNKGKTKYKLETEGQVNRVFLALDLLPHIVKGGYSVQKWDQPRYPVWMFVCITTLCISGGTWCWCTHCLMPLWQFLAVVNLMPLVKCSNLTVKVRTCLTNVVF